MLVVTVGKGIGITFWYVEPLGGLNSGISQWEIDNAGAIIMEKERLSALEDALEDMDMNCTNTSSDSSSDHK